MINIYLFLFIEVQYFNAMATGQKPLKKKVLKMKTATQKKKLFRANEPLLSVFMWGINHTVRIIHIVCSEFFSVFGMVPVR